MELLARSIQTLKGAPNMPSATLTTLMAPSSVYINILPAQPLLLVPPHGCSSVQARDTSVADPWKLCELLLIQVQLLQAREPMKDLGRKL